jgi:CBS domain-containing protein
VHPYDTLPKDELARVAGSFVRREYPAGAEVYHEGEPLLGLYLVKSGAVEVLDGAGSLVSLLGPRNSFGERGLMREGLALTTARATEDSVLILLPVAEFRRLIATSPAFERFFNRGRSVEGRGRPCHAQGGRPDGAQADHLRAGCLGVRGRADHARPHMCRRWAWSTGGGSWAS